MENRNFNCSMFSNRKKISLKYDSNEKSYHRLLSHRIIMNENIHIVAIFKDYMIFDYKEEFLKRKKEINLRLTKLSNYYKNYLKFFCKPSFCNFNINKLIQAHCDYKAELYYNKFYGKKSSRKNVLVENKCDEQSLIREKVFNTTIKDILENIQDFSNIPNNFEIIDKTNRHCNSNVDDSAIEKILQQFTSNEDNYDKTNNKFNLIEKENINSKLIKINKNILQTKQNESLNKININDFLNNCKKISKMPIFTNNSRNNKHHIESSKTKENFFSSLQSNEVVNLNNSKKPTKKIISSRGKESSISKQFQMTNTIDVPLMTIQNTNESLPLSEIKSRNTIKELYQSSKFHHIPSYSLLNNPQISNKIFRVTRTKSSNTMSQGEKIMKINLSDCINKINYNMVQAGLSTKKLNIQKSTKTATTPIINNINININNNINLDNFKGVSRNKNLSLVKFPSKENKVNFTKESLNSELSKEIVKLINNNLFNSYQNTNTENTSVLKQQQKTIQNELKNPLFTKKPSALPCKIENYVFNCEKTPIKIASSKKGLLEYIQKTEKLLKNKNSINIMRSPLVLKKITYSKK